MQGRKKPDIVYAGEIALTQQEYNNWRGKFGRACTPKQTSGRLDVPTDVHETFLAKGKKKEQMFEQFIRAGGDKEWVQKLCRCTGAWMVHAWVFYMYTEVKTQPSRNQNTLMIINAGPICPALHAEEGLRVHE